MKNSNNIDGFRFQAYDTGVIHIHDDKNNVKFIKSSKEFKTELKEALDDLEKNDGLVEIKSDSGPNLYVWSIGSKTMFSLSDPGRGTKLDLTNFLKSIK